MGGRNRVLASLTLSGNKALVTEVTKALEEVLERYDLKGQRPELGIGKVGRWEQDGGWYLDVEDPWSQRGGWVLDLEGKVTPSASGLRPREAIMRDVWAAFEQVKPDPNWDQSGWGPMPKPKPGPGPDPAPIRRPRRPDR